MLLLQRPACCPVHSLTPSLTSQLSESTRERGVDVGCALILEASDGRILLTRRAAHLRTFPGIWVPPGKHLHFSCRFPCRLTVAGSILSLSAPVLEESLWNKWHGLLWAGCPSCYPTNSVKALKETKSTYLKQARKIIAH